MLYKDKNIELSNKSRLEETTDFIFIRDKGPSDISIDEHNKQSISPLNILQFSEKEINDILDTLPDIVLKIQSKGNIVYCNSHNNHLNLTCDEIVEKNISEVFHPLTHLQFIEAINNLQKSKLPQVFEFQQFENSELRQYETRINKVSSQEEYVAIIKDISEQKRDEFILRKTEKKYRILFESAAYAMVLVNTEGKIDTVNSACEEMFGYDKNDLFGKMIEVIIPDKYVQSHQENIKDIFNGSGKLETNIFETFGQTKNGRIFPIEIRFAHAEFYEGHFIIASIIDITHRNRCEDKGE
ncbi:MAG: PAS domain S-box protein [Calditrichaceae bacterium]|nr:PAS domain S-box protein [Calditrichaceae bacterium]